MLDQIEGEPRPPRSALTRLTALENDEGALIAAVATMPTLPVLRLSRDYEALLRRAVEELNTHLAADHGILARTPLRGLIERVDCEVTAQKNQIESGGRGGGARQSVFLALLGPGKLLRHPLSLLDDKVKGGR